MWICLYLLLNNIYLPFILIYLSNITLKKTVKKIMLYDKQRKFAKWWESGKQEGRVVQQGVGAQAGRTIGKSVDSSLTLMRSLWILLKKRGTSSNITSLKHNPGCSNDNKQKYWHHLKDYCRILGEIRWW